MPISRKWSTGQLRMGRMKPRAPPKAPREVGADLRQQRLARTNWREQSGAREVMRDSYHDRHGLQQ
eukprot:6209415-Pleurochrysis_carterae.AAC.2